MCVCVWGVCSRINNTQDMMQLCQQFWILQGLAELLQQNLYVCFKWYLKCLIAKRIGCNGLFQSASCCALFLEERPQAETSRVNEVKEAVSRCSRGLCEVVEPVRSPSETPSGELPQEEEWGGRKLSALLFLGKTWKRLPCSLHPLWQGAQGRCPSSSILVTPRIRPSQLLMLYVH